MMMRLRMFAWAAEWSRLPRMRLSTVSFSLFILASCGGENTETDASTGATTTATATSGSTSGSTSGGATEGPTTDPTEATEPTSGATTHATHSSVTGESSSGEGGETGSTTVATTDDVSSSSGGVEPSGTSIVENDCAPDDGSALQFKIEVEAPVCGAQLAEEKLRILLWQGGPLPAGVYPIGEQTGFATYQIGNDEPTNSVDGTLTIESWVGDLVVGSYELTFVDDSVRQGDFSGPFCMVDTFCG